MERINVQTRSLATAPSMVREHCAQRLALLNPLLKAPARMVERLDVLGRLLAATVE